MPKILQVAPFSSNDIVLTFTTSPAFVAAELLQGGTSGATGQFYGPVNGAGTDKFMVRYGPGGVGPGAPTFANGEVVTGQVSGKTGTLSANQTTNGAYTLTSPAYGPVGAKSLSMFLVGTSASNQGSLAGTCKCQVSNDIIMEANYPMVQPTNWTDAPQALGAYPLAVTMTGGANCTFLSQYPLLTWRWFRFVWTPTYTSTNYTLQCNVLFLIDD